jgi:hypothetical protein
MLTQLHIPDDANAATRHIPDDADTPTQHLTDMRFIIASIGVCSTGRTQSSLIVDLILKKPLLDI